MPGLLHTRRYWRRRYARGEASGPEEAALGTLAWKRSVVRRFLSLRNGVLDAGCGDARFWERLPRRYVGVDWSPEAIARNAAHRPEGDWEVADLTKGPLPKRDEAVILSVLFHLPTDEDAGACVRNVAAATRKRMVVVAWRANPFARRWRNVGRLLRYGRLIAAARQARSSRSDGWYQFHHPPEAWLAQATAEGFEVVATEPDPSSPWGAAWVLERTTRGRRLPARRRKAAPGSNA